MFNLLRIYRWQALFVFVSLSIFSSLSHARAVPLVDPAPIKITAGATSEQVHNSVTSALSQRGWKLTRAISKSPEAVEIEYRVQTHIMAMRLTYSDDVITLSYERSENLNYKKNAKTTVIHPNYIVWAQQLADQIKTNLAAGDDINLPAQVAPQQQSQPQPQQPQNQLPKNSFSTYGHFEFSPATLAPHLATQQKAMHIGVDLDHDISVAMRPKISEWEKPENTRVLLVKPKIVNLRFIGSGTRFFAGRMAGRSNITVEVTFVDQATQEVVATTSLYRMAEASNGFTLARADYAMVEAMGRDIVDYIDKNYKAIK